MKNAAQIAWLTGVIHKYDPIGIAPESPTNEYEGEAIDIMDAAMDLEEWTSESILAIVHAAFVKMFSAKIAGSIDRECYTTIANKYLKALKTSTAYVEEDAQFGYVVRYLYQRRPDMPIPSMGIEFRTKTEAEEWAMKEGFIVRDKPNES